MKIAILISGSPRFTKDLDSFIDNLEGVNSADWFVFLWRENNPPDKLGYPGYILVSEKWRNIDYSWAKNKIESNLPTNHKLCGLELYDSSLIEYPTITGPQDHHINFSSIWKMHLGWNLVNKLKQNYSEKYDLVIRTRPDLSLTDKLDLRVIKQKLIENPRSVFVSKEGQYGHNYHINDCIAISTEENISIYSDLINHSVSYNKSGIMFHPENILAYHLIQNNLNIVPYISVELRKYFTKNIDGEFISDFGRWI